MKTTHILLLQYEGSVIIPAAKIARDYFGLTEAKFLQKCRSCDIPLPLMKPDPKSQKGLQGVHVQDLADYLDRCREETRSDLRKMMS